MVKERLRLYRDAGVTTLQARLDGEGPARLDTLARLIELAAEVSREPLPGRREAGNQAEPAGNQAAQAGQGRPRRPTGD